MSMQGTKHKRHKKKLRTRQNRRIVNDSDIKQIGGEKLARIGYGSGPTKRSFRNRKENDDAE